MGDEPYDLIVIGGGPAGYTASAHAARLGMRVACVEEKERLGGVCLRVGCIPSKALLDSSEYYHLAATRFAEHGVEVDGPRLDLGAMMARKDAVVSELTGQVRKLLDGLGVTLVHGRGRLAGGTRVEVAPADGGEPFDLESRSVLLAAGSEPVGLPSVPVDGDRIVTSTEALAFPAVPEHLVVVGGGYIGLELGSVWARLGAEVTVLEALPRVAATVDGQIGRYLERALKRQGLKLRVRTRVEGAEVDGDRVRVTVRSDGADGAETLTCDRVLVAVGRRPRSGDLGLDTVGVAADDRTGQIPVDAAYRTDAAGIHAVGDLVAGPMLAHKASAEAIAVVECLAGRPGEVDYDAIPAVVYTAPEVAGVGWTEERLKESEIPYASGTFPFGGVGRAVCLGETEGLAKVLAHARSDRILGVHIVGPRASELIQEAVLAIGRGATAGDLGRTVHGHPTLAEAVMEACRAVRHR